MSISSKNKIAFSILTIVLTFIVFSGYTFVEAISNLVGNPSFESSILTPWQIEDHRNVATYNLDTSTKIDGNQSIKITQPTAGTFYQTQLKQIIPIENGKEYAVSFWAKASQSYPLTLEWHKDSSPFSNYGLWAEINLENSWRQYEYVFTATQTDSQARFAFDIGNGTGSVWFDNVKVFTATITPPVSPELIWNGNFEAGSYFGWKGFSFVNTGSVVTDTNNPGSGSYSVRLFNPTVGTFYQTQLYQTDIPIEAGRLYALKFKVRGDNNNKVRIELTKFGNPWTNYGLWHQINASSTWQSYVINFVASGTDKARLNFGIGESTGNVWLDDISLEQVNVIVNQPDRFDHVFIIN